MSHVNTVTITLAEYEELKSLSQKYDRIKKLTGYIESVGSFDIKANYKNASTNLLVQADRTRNEDGCYSVSFNLKNMPVGAIFLIEKTH